MNIFKNRTVIGLLCIVLSLVICFAITPMFNRTISEKTEIVRVTKNIRIGDEITKDMVKPVEVGAYNLPESVVHNLDEVIGKYASADMVPGDYIIHSKVAEEPAAENAYLYNLNGEKQAISVSVKAFANGLSGKLISGDIVSVIAPDYRKQGSTIIPPELQYVEDLMPQVSDLARADQYSLYHHPLRRDRPTSVSLSAGRRAVRPAQAEIGRAHV